MPKSDARELFDDVVRTAVHPRLKALGFRKKATNFRRRHGGCVQVVNLQSSDASTIDCKMFYVNVGIAFDDVCRLTGEEIVEAPREFECDERGLSARLECLVPDAEERWVLTRSTVEEVRERLDHCMSRLADGLEHLDGVAAFGSHEWLVAATPEGRARIHWLLGDREAALAELKSFWEIIKDRPFATSFEAWIADSPLRDLVQ